MIAFDIETGPLDQEQILNVVGEFESPEPPGEFDPSSVKYGNTKDEKKRAEKLEASRKKHQELVENFEADVAKKKQIWIKEQVAKAALSATTGQVLAIGYTNGDKEAIEGSDGVPQDERRILANFWQKQIVCQRDNRTMVGHNILGFDLPFLIQRSWILDVSVPARLVDPQWGIAKSANFIDTMRQWAVGNRGDWTSLDKLSKAIGLDGKTEGITGADFARLWFEDREKAREYLLTDLRMTWEVANKLCIV